MDDRISQVYNMSYHKPKLWEIIVLHFFPMKTWRGEETIIKFKSAFGRMYLYEINYYSRLNYDNSSGVYN